MPELKPYYMQALMYALSDSDVGIATMVSPLTDEERCDNEVVVKVDWNSDRSSIL